MFTTKLALKAFLKRIPGISMVGRRINLALWDFHCWRTSPQRKLIKYGRKYNIKHIVQIGSNDGKTDDPIHVLIHNNINCRALMVEPVPFLFERLRVNYSGIQKQIQFANVAVTTCSGKKSFYYIDQSAKNSIPDLPEWYDQLGSFERNHISKHFDRLPDEFIVETAIITVSLADLFTRYSIERIDLLHIDTEGHDWSILQQLDLHKYHPSIILFEWKHISQDERQEAIAALGKFYTMTLLDVTGDMLCIIRQ